jgi:hypothetical protein
MRFRPANIRVINRRDSRSATIDAAFLPSAAGKNKKERAEKQCPDVTNELI